MRLRGVRPVPLSSPDTSPVDITVAGGVITDVSPASAWSGAWVMPGLWDHHVHMTEWARAARRLDLAATTQSDVLEVVGGAARAHEPALSGPTLIGMGLWHSRWDAPFGSAGSHTRADLDAVTGSLPTVLISADLHSAWLNSAAASAFRVSVPASGLLTEGAWFSLMPHLAAEDVRLSDRWVAEAAAVAASRGVTGIVDFEFHDTLAAWRRRMAGGFDTQRVHASVWPENLAGAIGAGLRTGDPLSPLLTMGRLKVIFDGSLGTGTAWCHAPYPDGTRGAANLSEVALAELMATAHAAGIESAIHAIGDRANTAALDAFARTGARGRIEHAQLLTPTDIARFAELGVGASVQPAHLLDDRDTAESQWHGRTQNAYAFADLLTAGATLEFGSDAPVAPLDPWLAIRAATTRTGDDRPAWHPEQLLDRRAALRASVATPGLTVGADADLAVLGEDPLGIPAAELQWIPVLRTLCAGVITHEA